MLTSDFWHRIQSVDEGEIITSCCRFLTQNWEMENCSDRIISIWGKSCYLVEAVNSGIKFDPLTNEKS